MSFSSTDLHSHVDQQLRELGYEICGDDDEVGWYWMLGDYKSTQTKLAFDTQAEASAEAISDLVQRTQELLAASRRVVWQWSTGSLAEAVRELDACAKAFEATVSVPPDNVCSALAVLCVRTATDNHEWTEIKGPQKGVGVERWFKHEDGRAAYMRDTQGLFVSELHDTAPPQG